MVCYWGWYVAWSELPCTEVSNQSQALHQVLPMHYLAGQRMSYHPGILCRKPSSSADVTSLLIPMIDPCYKSCRYEGNLSPPRPLSLAQLRLASVSTLVHRVLREVPTFLPKILPMMKAGCRLPQVLLRHRCAKWGPGNHSTRAAYERMRRACATKTS